MDEEDRRGTPGLDELRTQIGQINDQLLELLSRRGELALEVRRIKERLGRPTVDPERELAMLEGLVERNAGPFSDDVVRHLFREIFAASVDLMERTRRSGLLVGRSEGAAAAVVTVGGASIGAAPAVIAGPCAIESRRQLELVAERLVEAGVRLFRGGAFKPRSSPYSFQGLGRQGLRLIAEVARQHQLEVVTEVTDPRLVAEVAEVASMVQIGARNMHNYELLREVGRCQVPVLLKRGLAATVSELLLAAEYVALEGNEAIVLCERGIRTFARETRFTLDISSIPLIRRQSRLPVMVDVSHAAGRRDILAALARAALAAGAAGVMVEVHPWPAMARSDGHQQLDLDGFSRFLTEAGLDDQSSSSEDS